MGCVDSKTKTLRVPQKSTTQKNVNNVPQKKSQIVKQSNILPSPQPVQQLPEEKNQSHQTHQQVVEEPQAVHAPIEEDHNKHHLQQRQQEYQDLLNKQVQIDQIKPEIVNHEQKPVSDVKSVKNQAQKIIEVVKPVVTVTTQMNSFSEGNVEPPRSNKRINAHFNLQQIIDIQAR